MAARYTQKKYIPKVFDAVTLAANRTSDTFSVEGYNQMIVYVDYTEAGGSITALTMSVETTHPFSTSEWYFETEEDGSLPPTIGIDHNGRRYDLLDASTDPTSETVRFKVPVPISGNLCRLKLFPTSGDATDIVTAHVELSNQ